MFQFILNNFDFLPCTPLPTITTENEIIPDSAWCKLIPRNIFFKFFVQTFSSNFFQFFFFLNKKVFPPEQKAIQIQNYLNQNAWYEMLHCLWPLTKFQKIHWISKIPKPKCVLVILSNLDFFTLALTYQNH